MRRGALLNDAQLKGILPTSVAGGENAPGNWSLIAGFCGPGSLMLLGFLALMAPCGGSIAGAAGGGAQSATEVLHLGAGETTHVYIPDHN